MWVYVAHLFSSVLYFFNIFYHCYVLDPMLSVFLQCQCLIAASGFQFEDSKVVIRGFKSHDRQYNDQMKTIQSISQKTKEWATTKSRETTM
jgi:hypothetical protein